MQFKKWVVPEIDGPYAHLKRVRELFLDRTELQPNPKYLEAVLQLMGLEGAKPAPSPSVAAHRNVPGDAG